LEKLQEIVKLLAEGAPLPANHRDHPLIVAPPEKYERRNEP